MTIFSIQTMCYTSVEKERIYFRRKNSIPGGGGGRSPLYSYVPPQWVWFLSPFGLKTGVDFDHYGLKSGVVYNGATGAYKRICLFNSK